MNSTRNNKKERNPATSSEVVVTVRSTNWLLSLFRRRAGRCRRRGVIICNSVIIIRLCWCVEKQWISSSLHFSASVYTHPLTMCAVNARDPHWIFELPLLGNKWRWSTVERSSHHNEVSLASPLCYANGGAKSPSCLHGLRWSSTAHKWIHKSIVLLLFDQRY